MYNFADHATQPHPPTAIAPIGRSVGSQSVSQSVSRAGGQAGKRSRARRTDPNPYNGETDKKQPLSSSSRGVEYQTVGFGGAGSWPRGRGWGVRE